MPPQPMTFGIIANTQMENIWNVLPDFLDWIESQGPRVLICEDLRQNLNRPHAIFHPPEKLAELSDMVLSFGGDGTLLSTAKKVGKTQTPILGVNLGGLGYLAEISMQSLHPRIQELLSGSYRVEERMVLNCSVEGSDAVYTALNDIVIGKGHWSRVISLRATIGGRHLNTYTGDGLIVATPTGSTAYSLSSGGPIVEPGMQALIITPISPHTLADRPVVVGADKEIEVYIAGKHDKLALIADGKEVRSLNRGDKVLINRADYPVKLVLFNDKYFYDVLREKLKWGPPQQAK